MMSWHRAVTSWRHMTSCDMTKWTCTGLPIWKSVFQTSDLDLWPLTLTIELSWDFIKVNHGTKIQNRRSNGSAVRVLTNWQTHRWMDGQTGPILYPRSLTREGIIQWTAFSVTLTCFLKMAVARLINQSVKSSKEKGSKVMWVKVEGQGQSHLIKISYLIWLSYSLRVIWDLKCFGFVKPKPKQLCTHGSGSEVTRVRVKGHTD